MPGTWPVDGWTDGGQGTDCSLSCQPGQVSYPEWQAGNLPISSKLGLGQLNSVDVSCLWCGLRPTAGVKEAPWLCAHLSVCLALLLGLSVVRGAGGWLRELPACQVLLRRGWPPLAEQSGKPHCC